MLLVKDTYQKTFKRVYEILSHRNGIGISKNIPALHPSYRCVFMQLYDLRHNHTFHIIDIAKKLYYKYR